MFTVPETDDAKVFVRAADRGQDTFTLVEQDASAPGTICDWITRNIETAPAEKLRTALERAIKFRAFGKRKVAD
jgi:hypothetical protein